MALWDTIKGDRQWYDLPGDAATKFGTSFTSMQLLGTVYRQVSQPGISPGGTAADNVLAVFTLPAKAFDGVILPTIYGGSLQQVLSNRGLYINAQGSFGATANNKRIKIIVGATTAVVGSTVTGGTTIADTGVVATNTGGWSVGASVYKYGVAGSNTQIAVHEQSQTGAAVTALLAPAALTLVENAPIIIAITGNAATATTDIVFSLLAITGMN